MSVTSTCRVLLARMFLRATNAFRVGSTQCAPTRSMKRSPNAPLPIDEPVVYRNIKTTDWWRTNKNGEAELFTQRYADDFIPVVSKLTSSIKLTSPFHSVGNGPDSLFATRPKEATTSRAQTQGPLSGNHQELRRQRFQNTRARLSAGKENRERNLVANVSTQHSSQLTRHATQSLVAIASSTGLNARAPAFEPTQAHSILPTRPSLSFPAIATIQQEANDTLEKDRQAFAPNHSVFAFTGRSLVKKVDNDNDVEMTDAVQEDERLVKRQLMIVNQSLVFTTPSEMNSPVQVCLCQD